MEGFIRFLNFVYGLLFAVFIFTIPSVGQINTNLDSPTSQWLICVEPTCNPGGNPIGPTGYLVANKNGVTRDGSSLYLSVTGGSGVNFLTYRNTGATSGDYFLLDLWVYISLDGETHQHVLEYDAFVYTSPYRWMFGTQCVKNGTWWGWNDNINQWVNSQIPCNLSPGKWHHIEEWSHRDFTVNCSGMPCSYQDTIGIDNLYHNWNIITPASWLPGGWGNNSGVNLQIGLDTTGGKAYEWVDLINLTELGK